MFKCWSEVADREEEILEEEREDNLLGKMPEKAGEKDRP